MGIFIAALQRRLKIAESQISGLSETLDIVLDRLPERQHPQGLSQDEPSVLDIIETPQNTAVAALQQEDPYTAQNRAAATIAGSDLAAEPSAISAPSDDAGDESVEAERGTSWPLNFEELIGGKLPIWVGGIALIFAAFFLVRYSIEAGLLGPAARSVIAAVFGTGLIALSEFGGKLPKIGPAFVSDRRVGQSLAGAGVAILYGTLYMVSEIYGLIGVGTAFALMLVVTAAAFALSLRHGPPTALMGISGGFAAPWVAGMGAENMPSLLLYLAVFIAAVFGLAVWRRWLWLLLLASGGGLIWTMSLLIFAKADLPLLGLFIMAAAIGAVAAFYRFKDADGPWAEAARYLPVAAALLQLLLLLPKTKFSLSGWLFFGTICALTVALGLRDRKMLPLTGGAFALSLTAIATSWISRAFHSDDVDMTSILVSIAAFALFGGPALVKSLRNQQNEVFWGLLTAIGGAALWTMAVSFEGLDFSKAIWAIAAILVALPSAWLAWKYRGDGLGTAWLALFANSAAVIFLITMAALLLVSRDWFPAAFAFGALAAAAWAAQVEGKAVARIAIAPMAFAILSSLSFNHQLLVILSSSLAGEKALFDDAPTIAETAIWTLLPALTILGICWRPYFTAGKRMRMTAQIVGGIGIAAMIYLLLKQPLAIDSDARFTSVGFGERMAITHLLASAGWAAIHYANRLPKWPSLLPIGCILAGLALARFVYFDLLLLNPVMVSQHLGTFPIANLGTLHCALAAAWTWAYARSNAAAQAQEYLEKPLIIGGLLAMILTMLVTVRQWSLGSIISGDRMGSGENYLYSASLMVLAIFWLIRALRTSGTGEAKRHGKLLRISGLALITIVTLKVFLIDAAVLTGILRILSFLGLGIALIAIGWGYGKVMDVGKNRAQEG